MMRENRSMRLLRSAHIGPTIVVTAITFLLAHTLWPLWQSVLIATSIFLGQLCVGWTNDLVDADVDGLQNRKGKPLAQGLIEKNTVVIATYFALAACVLLSIFGPLGVKGGMVHLLGVGCGVSYNFYFKRSLLSPLPYIVAFAALPTSIALSKGELAPAWTVLVGGAFGLTAHFANVLKDMERDQQAKIFGLPQRLGTRASQLVTGSCLAFIAFLIPISFSRGWIVAIALIACIAILRLPKKYSFAIIMLLALIDVALLVTSDASLLITKGI